MRVSDNTSKSSVSDALRRTRGTMERLQMQNATQKKLLAPSDDPAANTKIMDIRTQATVDAQFEHNASVAKTRLQYTDSALSELYDLMVRAKEIAISQSSDASASADSRLGVAQEVASLYQQLTSIANRRIGHHHLFSGFKTQTPAYTPEGEYKGDSGEIPIEIQKDVFIAMNVPGPEVFEFKKYRKQDAHKTPTALERYNPTLLPGETDKNNKQDRSTAGEANKPQAASPSEAINVFRELDTLRIGLLTNDTISIRDTMERFDDIISNIVTIRAKLSSRVAGIDAAVGSTQRTTLQNAELASQLEDADYAELWSNMAKQESVLRSSLSSAQKLIQPTLLEFLR